MVVVVLEVVVDVLAVVVDVLEVVEGRIEVVLLLLLLRVEVLLTLDVLDALLEVVLEALLEVVLDELFEVVLVALLEVVLERLLDVLLEDLLELEVDDALLDDELELLERPSHWGSTLYADDPGIVKTSDRCVVEPDIIAGWLLVLSIGAVELETHHLSHRRIWQLAVVISSQILRLFRRSVIQHG